MPSLLPSSPCVPPGAANAPRAPSLVSFPRLELTDFGLLASKCLQCGSAHVNGVRTMALSRRTARIELVGACVAIIAAVMQSVGWPRAAAACDSCFACDACADVFKAFGASGIPAWPAQLVGASLILWLAAHLSRRIHCLIPICRRCARRRTIWDAVRFAAWSSVAAGLLLPGTAVSLPLVATGFSFVVAAMHAQTSDVAIGRASGATLTLSLPTTR